MATDPVAAKTGQFIPNSKKIIMHTKMLKQEEKRRFLRFNAPKKLGEYPYMCTFPGHWTIMKGVLIVK